MTAPFRSLAKLDQALSPGQQGCLRAGVYGDVSTWHKLSNSGTSTAQITISAYPGETAKVIGWVDLEGSYTTVSHLQIDGSNNLYKTQRAGTSCPAPVSQGLAIAGHNDIVEYDDYYQSVPSLRGNGIGIGWWGNADNTIVRFNTIHDVGGCDFFDHLIYLGRGNNVQIYDNWIWNDAHGWGVKLDPGPTNARIHNNVIDAAGSGFNLGNSSGSDPTAGNQISNNVVMNSVGVSNPDIPWSHPGVLVTSPGLLPSSTANTIYNNDSYNNAGGITDINRTVTPAQITLTANTTTNPALLNPANHNYSPTN